MKMSQLLDATLREVPADAEVVSHQLMARAGLIQKVTMGSYTYMPLGWRSMKKIQNIIRDEMDGFGCQELQMPFVQPAELWLQTGRWYVYGKELLRLKDRYERDCLLAPTHEEVITTMVKNTVRSYKSLPVIPYQISLKYRDERRPRFGVIRSREFLMKDAYSFDLDEDGLDVSYNKMYKAYHNVFNRCGLDFRPVTADSGAIGGSGSHEFMALSDIGESQILFCHDCDFAATDEIASVEPQYTGADEEYLPMEKVYTPNCHTVEELCQILGCGPERTFKTLCFMADGKPVVCFLRGDRMLSETKLIALLGCYELEFATDEQVRAMGMEPGFCGPVGLREDIPIIADPEVVNSRNYACGEGTKDYHLKNVSFGRGDHRIDRIADISVATKGAKCPNCGKPLDSARGIEVGQIFKLHTKYSEALNCKYVDENGEEQYMVMGCYGIGVGRTMAAVIEQNHDENGIIWPISVAPFECEVVPVNDKDDWLMEEADKLYRQLNKDGVETVIDDRKERPGVKFNDADLLGFPIRVTMGKKCREQGLAEIKLRATGEVIEVPLPEVADKVKELKAQLFAELPRVYEQEGFDR